LELQQIRNSARYLLAKSCYDLGLYSEAEEHILCQARLSYTKYQQNSKNKNTTLTIIPSINNNKSKNKNTTTAVTMVYNNMDEWIINNTINNEGSSNCPIPAGAIGLHLLGNICRKTNRNIRAKEYYRLALTLDPLLWISYEALCELGTSGSSSDGGADGDGKNNNIDDNKINKDGGQDNATSDNDDDVEVDDPNLIFGVSAAAAVPPILTMHMRKVVGGRMEDVGLHRGPFAARGVTAVSGVSADASGSVSMNRYGTPSTPYTGFGKMNIGTLDTTSGAAGGDEVNYNNILPSTTTTVGPRTRVKGRQGREGSFPHANLFATTPAALSAVDETQLVDGSTPHNNDGVNSTNPTIDRAKQVIAGLAYMPSPAESSFRQRQHSFLSDAEDTTQQQQRKLRFASDLTFSTTPMMDNTMMTQQFHPSSAVPFHIANVSTVKGEKRTLFSSNINDEDDINDEDEDTRKKSSKIDDTRRKSEMTQTTEQRIVAASTPAPLGGGESNDEAVLTPMADMTVHVVKILELLCGLGAAYKSLNQYRSRDAIALFRSGVPVEQINTGWVQHQIGKAYFEMSDYQNAHRALENMRKIDPHRIKGLDILSTTLWQLKKEVELSNLAQQAVAFDKMAPESWFVVGNCFSLQKEHETAITFFRRAIQLNPSFTYAHTLCGHEFTSNEDFDKAISCYRDAIRVDARHYNAWYGLGAIYFRQEKFDLAEYHFQRALDINSQSSVLHCHLGMAQHQNGKTVDALETLSGAFRLDPRNPQAHYQRATIFMSLDRPEDALAELEKVRCAAPKESSVHFNMGKVHKRLGQPEKAMRCFLTALDLDPKDNNLIKAAMDRLDEPDVEDEASVF
jgi:anaphase-promoting complex subunit 3